MKVKFYTKGVDKTPKVCYNKYVIKTKKEVDNMKKENICTSVDLKNLNLSKAIKNKMEWDNDFCSMDVCKIGEALVIVPARISDRVTQELMHENINKSLVEIAGDGDWGEDNTIVVKANANIVEFLQYLKENTYTNLEFKILNERNIAEF